MMQNTGTILNSKISNLCDRKYVIEIGFGAGLIRDGEEKDIKMLEQYYTDLCTIFLKRFTVMSANSEITDEETKKLSLMLQEILKVKKVIQSIDIIKSL